MSICKFGPKFEIYYERYGEGPALVLTTGIQGSGQRFVDLGYVDRLAAAHTLIVIDPLGHHRSSKPHDEAPYLLANCVDHMLAVLDAEGFETADLLGFSRGSLITAGAARLRPDRVRRAICLGHPTGELTWQQLSAVEPLLAAGDWDSYFAGFPVPVPEGLATQLIEWNDPKAIGAVIRASVSELDEWTAPLAEVPTPLLTIIGDQEPFFDSTSQQARAAGAELLVIEGADHVGSLMAVDQVVEATTAFLSA